MARRARSTAASLPPVVLAEPGRVIAEGTIPGRATPWKSPPMMRNGKACVWDRQYKRYTDWVKTVRAFASLHRPRGGCYGGPVHLELTFYLRPNGRTKPDTTNLTKSTEDGLQGVIIVNDTQVCRTVAARVMSATEPERVQWRIVAA